MAKWMTDREENWKGYGLLGDSSIDAHAIARRQAHLWPTVKRHATLLGLGIDQATAIVVQIGRVHCDGEGADCGLRRPQARRAALFLMR